MSLTKKFSTLAIALLIVSSINLLADTYRINGPKSWLGWTGKKVTGAHNGSVAIKSGYINVTGAQFKGSFAIDMKTIANDDIQDAKYKADLVKHLVGEEFFNVEKFPTATFEISKMEPYTDQWGATHKVFGKLTIKGVPGEINFPAKVVMNGNDFTASAEFILDRTKWGLKYGSGSFFDNLGDKAIEDNMKFNVNLVGAK
jgi:polyisoprenoid-binding protein YceI